ncbi:protein-tyrosine-phosphatase [Malassezia yamatoensis]|uniref:Protein-tyrosine-phosphatase n=1 Tax=Malassezia yamatoensis TaxID=253288 RepID=A0AAJ5YTP3_9BASI|nr:protein-tyrosine-phosphatase [Malassezia yamatoensis]
MLRLSKPLGIYARQLKRGVSSMSFTPPYRYIEADALAEQLRSKSTQPLSIAVVDVRDDDYEGGHIVGCIRAPSSSFYDRVNSLVHEDLKDYERVVFHCSLSQQRGPKSARIYRETLDNARNTGTLSTSINQQVLVLRDGFANFGPRFKRDKTLVEDWDEEAWQWR